MTYTPYYPDGWDDSPATSTPIVAAALDAMDAGIGAATDAAAAKVGLTGDQSIAGTKTFTGRLVIPDGTADTDAAAYGQIPKGFLPISALVPGYQYPTDGTMWATLTSSAPPVKYVVANVTSGPGSETPDTAYQTVIGNAQSAGIDVLGYVNTGDAGVDLATVQSQVEQWSSEYGVTSIFFDNASTDIGDIAYYTSAAGYVGGGGTIVFNHGAMPDQAYAAVADVVIVFEQAYTSWSSFVRESWFDNYGPGKFAIIVHDADESVVAGVLDDARRFGIGNVLVTDGTGSNPYSDVPSYWSEEITLDEGSISGVLALAQAYTDAETTRAEAAETLLAPKASPALTGNPTAPTQSASNNSTRLATTAYADGAVATETGRAETAEGLLAPLASPALTGNPTAPTQSAGNNSTRLATTAYADGAVATETTRAEAAEALLAPLAGASFTGPVSVSESGAAGGLLTVTNTHSTPSAPTVGLVANAAADSVVGIRVTGDTVPRLAVDSNGKLFWGAGGSSAADLTLARSSAALAQINGSLHVTRTVTGSPVFQVQNQQSAPTAAGTLLVAQSAADPVLGVQVSGDTTYRFQVDSNGKMAWGAGGSSAVDANLYRSGAGVLATDNTLNAVTAVQRNGLPLGFVGLFGDGSDGSLTYDGTTTILGVAPSSSVYTLTRDVLATSLTVNNGVTIKTNGFRIFWTGTLTNAGTIYGAGGPPSGTNGANQGPGGPGAGPLTSGQNGIAGGTGSGGAGTSVTTSAAVGCGASSAGGSGSAGAGGAGVAANAYSSAVFRNPAVLLGSCWLVTANNTGRAVTGAPSGGAGGGDGTNKGGAGGSGGGVVVLAGPALVNNGTITAAGGNGGTATVTTGGQGCGGGGGGGGGLIVTYTLTAPTGSGSMTAAGGTHGTGTGTGVNGTDGGAGTVLNIVLA